MRTIHVLVAMATYILVASPVIAGVLPPQADTNTESAAGMTTTHGGNGAVAVPKNLSDRVLGEPFEPKDLVPVLPLEADRSTKPVERYRLRVVYVIPHNRVAQPEGEAKLRAFVEVMQRWFADRMELMGYVPKTFTIDPDPNGSGPKIDVIESTHPDSWFHGDLWGRVLADVDSWGIPVWQSGTVLLIVAETQIQDPDGSIREGTGFVGGATLGFSGVGMVTGDTLARLSESMLTDDRPYAGMILPGVGPYPLVQNVSFPWFEGTTLSSTSSSAYGATIHELSHGFNLGHEFRNDANFNGNLMGNGLRGMRGALFPERYPDDNTVLSSASALMLNYSRYFNPDRHYRNAGSPDIRIDNTSLLVPKGGLCGPHFTVRSDLPLAGALLATQGAIVGDMKLNRTGTRFTGDFLTDAYVPGQLQDWQVIAIDRQGNYSSATLGPVACETGHNQAPHPFITVSKTDVRVGEQVRLDASGSVDPDGDSSAMVVQWDVNGDGKFDTRPDTNHSRVISYAKAGVYRIVARLTDQQGQSSLSAPLGIRVGFKPQVIDLDVDLGDPHNVIDLRTQHYFWVALLSSTTFLPLDTEVESVRLGPGEAEAIRRKVHDINRDGVADLMLQFSVRDAALKCGVQQVVLTAETSRGQRLTGSGIVHAVHCK